MKLICFPYAGGSAAIYHDLKRHLSRYFEVVPIDYPGHGMRMGEDLCETLEGVAEDAYKMVKELTKNGDYALFGYSMGALVAYEVARKLECNKDKLPKKIIFTASNPPGIKEDEDPIFEYEDDVFLKAVIAMGGMTEEILADEELKSFFVPILRNDFRLIHYYSGGDYRLSDDIVVLYTSEEKRFLGWKNITEKTCRLIQMPGGHFFIHNHADHLASVIKAVLDHG